MATQNLDSIVNSVPSNLRPRAKAVISALLQESFQQKITDKAQIAYILATAEYESRMGTSMSEIWDPNSVPDQRDYDAPGDPKGLGNRSNNTPNQNYTNGDGYRYRGRGYAQVTGRANYQNWSNELGVDLVNNPDLATDPVVAAKITVRGMKDGSFTGYRLNDFVREGETVDFRNARRVINGLDRADDISAIANSYYEVLQQVDLQQLKQEVATSAPTKSGPTKPGPSQSKTQPAFTVSGSAGGPQPKAKSAPVKVQAAVTGTSSGPASTIVQYGDRGDAVKQVQTALNRTGAQLEVDGIFGRGTEQAVMNFQRNQGLEADGIVGPTTRKALSNPVQQSSRQSVPAFKTSSAAVGRSSQPSSGVVKLDPLRIPPGETQYGASRNGGSRRHAGTDTYNPKKDAPTEAPQATLGGVILRVGTERDANGNPVGYGNYIDIYNPVLQVVERIAEFDQAKFTQADVGKTIPAGTVVGLGAGQTGIIHREARPYEIYRQGPDAQYGFSGTVDWVKYMEQLKLYQKQGQDLIPTGRVLPAQQMNRIQASLTPEVETSITAVIAQGTPIELPSACNCPTCLTASLQRESLSEPQPALMGASGRQNTDLSLSKPQESATVAPAVESMELG